MTALLGRVLGAIPLKVWLVLLGAGVVGAGGWMAWQEYRTALAEAASARQALDTARAESAQRQLVIDALWRNAQSLEDRRRQLAETQADLTRTASNRLAHIQELQHENARIRRWADTRLPDAIGRMRDRPAVTGADAYREALPDTESVHASGQPSDNQR